MGLNEEGLGLYDKSISCKQDEYWVQTMRALGLNEENIRPKQE